MGRGPARPQPTNAPQPSSRDRHRAALLSPERRNLPICVTWISPEGRLSGRHNLLQMRDQRLLLWILLGGEGWETETGSCMYSSWSGTYVVRDAPNHSPSALASWRLDERLQAQATWTDLIETETAMEAGVRRGMRETQQLTVLLLHKE